MVRDLAPSVPYAGTRLGSANWTEKSMFAGNPDSTSSAQLPQGAQIISIT